MIDVILIPTIRAGRIHWVTSERGDSTRLQRDRDAEVLPLEQSEQEVASGQPANAVSAFMGGRPSSRDERGAL